MVVERFEGSPRSWGFIAGWCVRRQNLKRRAVDKHVLRLIVESSM